MYTHDRTQWSSHGIPEFVWEKWALGEASREEIQAIEAATTPQQRATKRAGLEQSNRTILDAMPAEKAAADIRWRARQAALLPRRGTFRLLRVAIPVAASCLAVALWVVGPWTDQTTDPWSDSAEVPNTALAPKAPIDQAAPAPLETVRVKGDPRLLLYRQKGDESVELKNRDTARPGDLIQVMVLASGAAHGVVLSKDGRGSVTLHFPESNAASTSLRQGDAWALPHSYELDDAPEFERFYLFTAAAPLSPSDLTRLLESSAGTPEIPDGIRMWELTLLKASN